jgi:hypothetical protein
MGVSAEDGLHHMEVVHLGQKISLLLLLPSANPVAQL